MFVNMDTDDSGTLSIEEFKKAMALHPEIPMAQVEKMFHDMDITHSGEVDYTEFIAAANAKNASVEKPSCYNLNPRPDPTPSTHSNPSPTPTPTPKPSF